jgi:hypothetical protein
MKTFEVFSEKQFVTKPLIEWRHLVTKCKISSIFLPFLTQTQCKRAIEKILSRKKLQLIENWPTF